MTADKKGSGLFIVDNSISGWTGLRYLKEWSELAQGMDVATGFFEIGSLLEMDGRWQKLDKIRILRGDTRKRGAIEGYATGRLFPKYGIFEEH